MVTLYRKHATGSIGYWRIFGFANPNSEEGLIEISYAPTMDGAVQTQQEVVVRNSSGRTINEQIGLRINSRVSRMLDKGYKRTIDEAQSSSDSNQLGLIRPMLAKKVKDVSHFNKEDAILQKKLDGHRCLITKHEGKVVAYSRQGKFITTIPHITEPLHDRLCEGDTLDGELYYHGVPLQTLSSWIKRAQPNSQKLMYVVYDTVAKESFRDRERMVYDIVHGLPPSIVVLDSEPYYNDHTMQDRLQMVRKAGFEGLMLRTNDAPYEPGKRSSSLLKVKEWLSTEATVVDVVASKDGWGICVCMLPNGIVFEASAPGSMQNKIRAFKEKEEYIGKTLTVEFAHWTNDGKPFQPTAIRFREDV